MGNFLLYQFVKDLYCIKRASFNGFLIFKFTHLVNYEGNYGLWLFEGELLLNDFIFWLEWKRWQVQRLPDSETHFLVSDSVQKVFQKCGALIVLKHCDRVDENESNFTWIRNKFAFRINHNVFDLSLFEIVVENSDVNPVVPHSVAFSFCILNKIYALNFSKNVTFALGNHLIEPWVV